MKKKILLFTLLAALFTINITAFAAKYVRLDFIITRGEGSYNCSTAVKTVSSSTYEIFISPSQGVFESGSAINFKTTNMSNVILSNTYTITSPGSYDLPYNGLQQTGESVRLWAEVNSLSLYTPLWIYGDWTP